MTKRMLIMLLAVGLLFGLIFGFKAFVGFKTKEYFASNKPPPAVVTTVTADAQSWQPQLNAVGSVRAVRGVDVTSEIAGLVRDVNFKSGQEVKKGQLLIQLNADSDIAQLHAAEAAAAQAQTVYNRDKLQFEAEAVSKALLDADLADLKTKQAQTEQQVALVAKKSIRAPFSGRLGITTVNPGQYLNPGDKIVTLQAIDPVFVDFNLPQQQLTYLANGLKVTARSDSFPGHEYAGNVQAIDPKIDPNTRNVQVAATLANPKRELLPGMFANVNVDAGGPKQLITLPQTAVSFNPYGSTVYIVMEASAAEAKAAEAKAADPKTTDAKKADAKAADAKAADAKPADGKRLVAKQSFVVTGETRGDQIAIISGVKAGEVVVTSGQLKLRNGSDVIVNNKAQPSNDAAPKPVDQ